MLARSLQPDPALTPAAVGVTTPSVPVPVVPSVVVSHVSRRFGRRWALSDVSFSVAAGTTLMIAGRNGSGKSTLLRVLATALRADTGTASVEGHDLRRDTQEVRRRVGLLAHQLHLYDSLSALENLQIAARFLGRAAEREDVLPLLAEVQLASRADDVVSGFSAGMRKRLGLARILLKQPSVVFLDEPYGQLDPPGFRKVDALIASLRARDVTVLIATHLLERVGPLCDAGLVLTEGRVTWRGPARDLASHGGVDTGSTAE